MELLVVNVRRIKVVPGRKTGVQDAEWIAGRPQYGLLRGSYIPEREQRELVHYRTKLTQERSRIQQVLEGANIKLGDVVSDIMGKPGESILRAIVAGNAEVMALAYFCSENMSN